jgi:DNA repair protein SbcD/Mre11
VPVAAAVPLRTVRGTLHELAELDPGEAWLRVYVREQPRAGLREQVQELLPRALEVRIDPDLLPEPGADRHTTTRAGRTPAELFTEYLTARGHHDDAVRDLFAELYDEVVSSS